MSSITWRSDLQGASHTRTISRSESASLHLFLAGLAFFVSEFNDSLLIFSSSGCNKRILPIPQIWHFKQIRASVSFLEIAPSHFAELETAWWLVFWRDQILSIDPTAQKSARFPMQSQVLNKAIWARTTTKPTKSSAATSVRSLMLKSCQTQSFGRTKARLRLVKYTRRSAFLPFSPVLQLLFFQLGKAGVWACRIAPGPHLKMFDSIFGVKSSDIDQFHELICHEEVFRLGVPGLSDGLGSGFVIGLPAVVAFATPALKSRVVPECISGDKQICLAISEPAAGSDVANIEMTAVKSPCGKFYIVNGVKKWFTSHVNNL